MSEIDPEKLEEALTLLAGHLGAWGPADYRSAERVVIDAARAHLATLPRWKEVEREYWEVLDHNGTSHGVYDSEGDAHGMTRYGSGRFVVRLTVTVKVRA